LIVSWSDSPFDADVDFASDTDRTRPPRRSIAVSNDRRVRVLGSKKSVARIFPRNSSSSLPAAKAASYVAARSRMRSMSPDVN
jgi:hypothetical protein